MASKTQDKETGRLEAFSDGVFAFAITLLVLDLKDPTQAAGNTASLLQGLYNEWPTFFAFVTSFMTILIMWIGHHQMFNYVHKIDRRFMFFNGFLLFFVTLTPFTTSLVGNHITHVDSSTAASVYAGSFLLLASSWNLLWRRASQGGRLLRSDVTPEEIRTMRRNFYIGPIVYAAALVLSFVSGLAALGLMFAVAVFYAVS